MTKRWKSVFLALSMPLVLAASAWGDVAVALHPMERVECGAAIGGAMVFVALLPALGGLLLAGVRSGKLPKWRIVLDVVLLLGVEVGIWVFLGNTFFTLGMQIFGVYIPPRVQIAGMGVAVLAAVALVVGRRTQSRVWLVASAVVAACAIVLLAWTMPAYHYSGPADGPEETNEHFQDMWDEGESIAGGYWE